MYLADKLDENVFYYKDVVLDHKKYIEVLEETENNESIYPVIPQWTVWNASDDNEIIFGNKKDFVESSLDWIQGKDRETAEYLINTMNDARKKVAHAFFEDRGLGSDPNISPFVGISKWNPGCQLGVHCDTFSGDRTLWWTIIIYLNDDYNGGELSFIIKDIDFKDRKNALFMPSPDFEKVSSDSMIDFTVKPEAGSALVFPSGFPYMHQVHLVKPGKSRYMCQTHLFIEGYDHTDEEQRRLYNAGAMYA